MPPPLYESRKSEIWKNVEKGGIPVGKLYNTANQNNSVINSYYVLESSGERGDACRRDHGEVLLPWQGNWRRASCVPSSRTGRFKCTSYGDTWTFTGKKLIHYIFGNFKGVKNFFLPPPPQKKKKIITTARFLFMLLETIIIFNWANYRSNTIVLNRWNEPNNVQMNIRIFKWTLKYWNEKK